MANLPDTYNLNCENSITNPNPSTCDNSEMLNQPFRIDCPYHPTLISNEEFDKQNQIQGFKPESMRKFLTGQDRETLYLYWMQDIISSCILLASKGNFEFCLTPDNIYVKDDERFCFLLPTEKLDKNSYKNYLAPEINWRDDHEFDEKSVVWNIGCVMVFIITRTDPKVMSLQDDQKKIVRDLKNTVSKSIYGMLKKVFRLVRNKRIGLRGLYDELKLIE